jgi:hypothetical protein
MLTESSVSFQYLSKSVLNQEQDLVTVDSSGFYEDSARMEEMFYCIGAVSLHEDCIYAAHISPGDPGKSPEKIMEGFQEGSETFIVEGLNSDTATFEMVLDKLDNLSRSCSLESSHSFTIYSNGDISFD